VLGYLRLISFTKRILVKVIFEIRKNAPEILQYLQADDWRVSFSFGGLRASSWGGNKRPSRSSTKKAVTNGRASLKASFE
jgi:hypothetical protein